MPRAKVAAATVQPSLRKRRRPPTGLPFVGSMVIARTAHRSRGRRARRPRRPAARARRAPPARAGSHRARARARRARGRARRRARTHVDERLDAAIKTLSTEALDANSARFLELAETHLSGYVRPLKDSLERMDQQLESVERVRQEAYGALQTQVTTLVRAGRKPHERPAHAARPRPLGRGPAAQRRRVRRDGRALRLRRAGDRHRRTTARSAPTSSSGSPAASTSSSTRRRRSPPTSTRSRRRTTPSASAASPTTRARCASTSTKLSAKGYWRQFEPSPDFVVMFLPDESYLRAAHEHDPALQEYAWSSNVILASPSTLMILLRTVAMTWQQETRRGERARGERRSGASCTSASRPWARTSASSGDRSTARSTPTTRPSARSSGRCSPQARRFEQHGITGSSRRSCSRSSARRDRSPPRSSSNRISSGARGDLAAGADAA